MSIEAKGNWDELTKKLLSKLFPISKVQELRRQMLNFKQGEDEGIDVAWDSLMNYLSKARTWDFLVTWCCIPFIFR
jgi:hypothetical protein